MKYADLFWVNLPAKDGREQRGRRPAIIWQDTDLFPHLPTVVVIPVSSQLDSLRFAPTVLLQPTAENGLSMPSVALVFQMVATDRKRFGTKIGHLDDSDLQSIAAIARQLQRLP